MLKEPGNWRKHHEGGARELMPQRHFSFLAFDTVGLILRLRPLSRPVRN
jgi:hypothetical protein